MSRQLANETPVLEAVRRLLAAGLGGHDVVQPMAAVVAATSALSLSNIDAWETKLRVELYLAEGSRSRVGQWKFWNRPARFASWLDLCNGSGFKREACLRALSEGAPNAFFFSLALRRINDWVPQVRSACHEQLPKIARRTDPRHVTDALWHALQHCASWGRLDDSASQVLGDIVSIDHVANRLESMIMQATAGPAWVVLAQAARSPALDHALAELAAAAVQPSVRATAYRFLLERQAVWIVDRKWRWTDVRTCKGRFEPTLASRSISVGEPFVPVLERAIGDRSVFVRRVAADMLIKHLSEVGADASHLARRLAADPWESVASRGRFALAKLGGGPPGQGGG